MKTILVAGLLAVTSLTSVPAFAQSGNAKSWGQTITSSGPSLSRAQVAAELRQAQANNTVAYGEFSTAVPVAQKTSSNLTRRQVKNEASTLWAASELRIYVN